MKLNSFEQALLIEIANYNPVYKDGITALLSCLEVVNREYTGVGLYVSFDTQKQTEQKFKKSSVCLGSSKLLYVDTLQYNLTYELNFTEGKISFLEIVTNGDESWRGDYEAFDLKRE